MALAPPQPLDAAIAAELDLRLGELELQRPAPLARPGDQGLGSGTAGTW